MSIDKTKIYMDFHLDDLEILSSADSAAPSGDPWPSMRSLAIVGSQRPNNERMARFLVRMAIHCFRPAKIVSGGAAGVDTLAEVGAGFYGIPFQAFLPKHQRWEPDGFRDRNIQIAEACTHLVRIANWNSKTYGSGWTHDYARKIGKKVYQVYL